MYSYQHVHTQGVTSTTEHSYLATKLFTLVANGQLTFSKSEDVWIPRLLEFLLYTSAFDNQPLLAGAQVLFIGHQLAILNKRYFFYPYTPTNKLYLGMNITSPSSWMMMSGFEALLTSGYFDLSVRSSDVISYGRFPSLSCRNLSCPGG